MAQVRGERVACAKRRDKSERPGQVAPSDVPARLAGALTDAELGQVVGGGGHVITEPPVEDGIR